MTPAEKLALAQRSYTAFSAGPDSEALVPLYHPECEWRMGHIGASLGTEAFRGHDALRAFVSALDEGWEGFAVEIDDAKITGEGVLLVRGHTHGRSRGIHIELSMQVWQEIEFRERLILSVVQMDEPPPEWDEATLIT
jgi:SnoaL-like domain